MNTKEMKTGSIHKMFGHRFIAGSWSAFASVIVIVMAVVINLIAAGLPNSATQFDMTNNALYSLSDQTKQIAASLNKDVKLYLLASSGSEDTTITRFLNRYTTLSSHISVENIDPTLKPTFLKKYDLETSRLFQNNLLLNALNWMSNREESISIRAKSMNEERLTVPAAASSFWSVIMIGMVPACLIAAGIVIYVRRKRR